MRLARFRTATVLAAATVIAVIAILVIAVPGLKSPDTVTSATMAPPTVSGISPVSGPVGTTVTVNGTVFGTTQGTSRVTFNGKDAASCPSWSASQVKVVVPAGATSGPVTVTTAGGTSNGATFAVTAPTPTPPPQPPVSPSSPATPAWFLAEGTTDWGFDTYIAIENPNATAVTAKVTYMTKGGPVQRPDVALPALSQTTVNPRGDLGATDFSTKVECKEGKTIAVDRTMTWRGAGAASPESHSSIGVTAPAKVWYLPEGSSKWGFECWLLIQNPNSAPVECQVTYMIEGKSPKTVKKTVAANSRASYSMADDIGAEDASIRVDAGQPVIPERAMYRNNRREGHDSIGTTAPARDYYLAEGTTDWGFTTYVLVQNPNASPAKVTITYMTPYGPQAQPAFTMPASSRKTIRVNDVMPLRDLSTAVNADKPIIAERAMYWDNGTGEACHDSIGMAAPHTTFYFPDGQAGSGFETWTLVQNPNAAPVTVDVFYLTPSGAGNVKFSDVIPANSRKSYSMGDRISETRAAVLVQCRTTGKKIMAERAMYSNNRGVGTDTIGGYSD